MSECKHGLPFAARCDKCDALFPKEPTPQQLLGELMDALGVYNDGSTPKVLWDRCIARVKELRDPLGVEGFSWHGRSWS